jgi:LysR family transcriptional regulator, transcription activator of glutamate synthase operon
VDLDELRWFVVLAETEHVTDAAAELRIAQPTLSRALNRLEQQAGAPLFDRVNRRLHLNAYGQIMLEHARRGIDELDSAVARIAALRDPDSGTVRLAFLHSLASWLVPDLLRQFRIDGPNVQFDLHQGAAHEISQQLLSGRADVAILSPQPEGPAFAWHQLYVERLCVVMPRGHRLASRATLRLAETADEPFIALGEDFGLRHLTDELWADAGFAPRIVFEAMEIPTMEGLVAAGFGVAVVPVPRPKRGEPTCVYVPLSHPAAKRQVGVAWIRDRPLPPAAERFRSFVTTTDLSD